jgi:hypothetical protein
MLLALTIQQPNEDIAVSIRKFQPWQVVLTGDDSEFIPLTLVGPRTHE